MAALLKALNRHTADCKTIYRGDDREEEKAEPTNIRKIKSLSGSRAFKGFLMPLVVQRVLCRSPQTQRKDGRKEEGSEDQSCEHA